MRIRTPAAENSRECTRAGMNDAGGSWTGRPVAQALEEQFPLCRGQAVEAVLFVGLSGRRFDRFQGKQQVFEIGGPQARDEALGGRARLGGFSAVFAFV